MDSIKTLRDFNVPSADALRMSWRSRSLLSAAPHLPQMGFHSLYPPINCSIFLFHWVPSFALYRTNFTR